MNSWVLVFVVEVLVISLMMWVIMVWFGLWVIIRCNIFDLFMVLVNILLLWVLVIGIDLLVIECWLMLLVFDSIVLFVGIWFFGCIIIWFFIISLLVVIICLLLLFWIIIVWFGVRFSRFLIDFVVCLVVMLFSVLDVVKIMISSVLLKICLIVIVLIVVVIISRFILSVLFCNVCVFVYVEF